MMPEFFETDDLVLNIDISPPSPQSEGVHPFFKDFADNFENWFAFDFKVNVFMEILLIINLIFVIVMNVY